MRNLFIYSRISTLATKKNFQTAKCLEYVKKNNIKFDRLCKIREINATGIKKVPKMQAGDIFLVFGASRISRIRKDLNRFLSMCEEKGVKVYSVKEGELKENVSNIILAGMEEIK